MTLATVSPTDMSADNSSQNPLAEFVDNLVYEPVQVHEHGVDLTAGAVYEVAAPGRIDFGGDELEDADLEPVDTELREPDDEYGWWRLEGGQYVVQLNEFLTDPEVPLLLQPRNELLARGGSHPSVRVDSHLPLLPLSVADGGLELKENARISTLVPLAPVGDGGSGANVADAADRVE
ncbi:deoxycytidine triphosphate deaminase [Halopiger thermotolerans]